MRQFDYTAQCENLAAISGTVEAVDADEGMKQLLTMKLTNIELREAKKGPLRRRVGSDDFIFFNEQLASLAKTGIALDAGLRQLARDIRSRPLRRALGEMAADIETGLPLDQALEKHAGRLPALYTRVVRAGLQSGQLSATLLNLSHHLRLVAETRRLVVDALTYPCVVLCAAALMMGAILWVVVPQFEVMFTDFDVVLPSMTLGVMALSHALPEVVLVGVVLVVLLVLIYSFARLSPAARGMQEQLLFAAPVIGGLARNSIRSRFFRAVAFSVNTGITLPEALRLAADATASPAAAREAGHLADEVERGGSLFEACRATTLIPSMFGYVLEISADRNNVGDALVQLAKAYERRAIHAQSLLRAWVAPLAVVGVGVVIGLCIIALFMPMVGLIESVSM